MNREHVKELLQRFRMGLCTPEEIAAISQWYESAAASAEWSWTDAERDAFRGELWTGIQGAMHSTMEMKEDPVDQGHGQENGARLRRLAWSRWAAAAAVLLGLTIGAYWIWGRPSDAGRLGNAVGNVFSRDVLPGGNKATLTLENGATIILDSTRNGLIGQQGNVGITKQENGKLVYGDLGGAKMPLDGSKDGKALAGATISYNTLTTPRGGQYQLILPDGTKVWLNAASSIRYPTAFSGKERRVEVTGEAYFEVVSNVHGNNPFIVSVIGPGGVQGGQVEVLGTHFNVNAYADDEMIRTTLLNGAVRLTTREGAVVLKPGQQAGYGKTGKPELLMDAEVDDAVAWKNGIFQFDEASIETVMRQVERWYDIEVSYAGKIPVGHFSGTVDRKANISQVLEILKLSAVHFQIDGRRIVILPN